eukprot:IDg23058t1
MFALPRPEFVRPTTPAASPSTPSPVIATAAAGATQCARCGGD